MNIKESKDKKETEDAAHAILEKAFNDARMLYKEKKKKRDILFGANETQHIKHKAKGNKTKRNICNLMGR